MPDIAFSILYVADTARSAAFYAAALGREPVEASPGFAMIPAGPGLMLGLWRREGVVPVAQGTGGGELCLTLDSAAAVTACHAEWVARGVAMALPPSMLDFGFGFVALDPDGH
ncbi:MAG: drug:proton antiporter, partial [Roseomonas sp.]|nr:drug:proton antiporter [Roseomonas sp.]